MKLSQICRYIGLIFGGIGALFIIGGVIGYFVGEFMGVRNFSWFFWAANTFILFAIFSMVVHISCNNKNDAA